MKTINLRTKWAGTLCATGLFATLACGQATANDPGDISSQQGKQGYSLGYTIGGKLAQDLDGVDFAALAKGFSDAIQQRAPPSAPIRSPRRSSDFETQRAEVAQAEMAAIATANAEAGDAFRAEFAQEEGTVILDSGLLYPVIEPGTGAPPEPGASVTVHDRGSLVEGTAIDDSYARGEPVTVSLDRVLPDWSAALERMPAGARWKVVIPPSLAYGETGAMGFVEPNATLIFEFERLDS
jgi:FKBP-type peptidyl-prolyl cis-trans isomerase FklB